VVWNEPGLDPPPAGRPDATWLIYGFASTAPQPPRETYSVVNYTIS